MTPRRAEGLVERIVELFATGLVDGLTPAEVRLVAAWWCHAADVGCDDCREGAMNLLRHVAHRALASLQVP